MQRLEAVNAEMLDRPGQQISLTDPDARSMATSGRGSGVVGYNAQASVDTTHHLIVAHEVTNVGNDRSQLSAMAEKTKAALEVEELDVVADRGYFSSLEILACKKANVTVTLPKPVTSGVKAKGRFGKQDFRYMADEDVYICPADERLKYYYTNEERGLTLRRYGPTLARLALSKTNAPRESSAASPAGNTSIFSKTSSADLMRTRKPCVNAGRPSSIPSAPLRRGWVLPTF
jgi:transposase